MKKKWLALFCAVGLTLSILPAAFADEESPLLPGEEEPGIEQELPQREETTVIVGLYYGSNTLSGVNLQNATEAGSGYRFGYLDDSRTFQLLGNTEEIDISVVKGEMSGMGLMMAIPAILTRSPQMLW